MILDSGTNIFLALIAIGFGLLNCFFGYRVFRFLLGVYGFLLGVFVGLTVAGHLAAGQTVWLIVGAIAGGLVGAVLVVLLYLVGVFLVGAVAGVLVANAIGVVIGIDMPILVVIIVAVVVGIIALIAQRAVLILVTAFGGAWGAVAGGLLLFTGRSLPDLAALGQRATWEQAGSTMLGPLFIWLALSIVGSLVQFRTTAEAEEGPIRPAERARDRW
jgi:hypothetical protein